MKPPQSAFDHRMAKPPRIPSKDKLDWLEEHVIKFHTVRGDYLLEFKFQGPKDQPYAGKIHSSSLDNAIIRVMHGIWHPQVWDWNPRWGVSPMTKWNPEVSLDEEDENYPAGVIPCGCGVFYRLPSK